MIFPWISHEKIEQTHLQRIFQVKNGMSHLPQVGLVGYHAYSILELREVDAQVRFFDILDAVSGDINGKWHQKTLETTKKKQGDFIRIWRKKQNMNSLDRYCNICFRGNCFETFKRWLDSTTNVGECSSLSSEKSFPGEDIFVTRSNWKWWLKVTLGPQNFVVP